MTPAQVRMYLNDGEDGGDGTAVPWQVAIAKAQAFVKRKQQNEDANG